MALPLQARSATNVGLHHPKNEDSHALLDLEDGARVLLVCDGMGGMGRGDEASALAVQVITEELARQSGFPTDRMRHALRMADDVVRDRLCRVGEGQPGSTAVMVYVQDGAAHVTWVGDSRAYLVRQGRVVERTRDHKLVEELVDAGQITAAQAKASALAHVVTRALGGRSPDEQTVRPGALGYPWKLMHGDRILVCSDGLSDLVEDEELGGMVTEGSTEDVVERLVQVALDRGGHDNITVIVATWEGPDWVEEDVATPVMPASREVGVEDLRLPDEDATLPPFGKGDLFDGEDTEPNPRALQPFEPGDANEDGRVTEEIDPADRSQDSAPRSSTPAGAPRATPAPTDRKATPAGAPRAATPPPAPASSGSQVGQPPVEEPDRRWMGAVLAAVVVVIAIGLLYFARR
ncbi:MAG: serine/threonine-protein phosphatase [Alphaproteobacteria bacterium]|nr:serine/threonine-protein phosphatase [Alphaproteobacteria bacterium]